MIRIKGKEEPKGQLVNPDLPTKRPFKLHVFMQNFLTLNKEHNNVQCTLHIGFNGHTSLV